VTLKEIKVIQSKGLECLIESSRGVIVT